MHCVLSCTRLLHGAYMACMWTWQVMWRVPRSMGRLKESSTDAFALTILGWTCLLVLQLRTAVFIAAALGPTG